MSSLEVLWSPDSSRKDASQWSAFARSVGRDPDPEALFDWSVREPDAFWPAVFEFAGLRWMHEPGAVTENWPAMPGTRWFPGGRLNFAQNLLRFDDDRTAIVGWNEHGPTRSLTTAQLRDEVRRAAGAMRSRGVGVGDRVAGYLPTVAESVVGMLAAASLGATWSSCSPDFGVEAARDRFGQIEPKLLIAGNGYQYAGKRIDVRERVRGLVASIPSIQHTVVVANLPDAEMEFEDWAEFLARGEDSPLEFESLPFDHPLYVLYSSGTTGLPKAIVHGAGGTLLQHAKEHLLHVDLRPGDVLFYYTTCGWMMWNWLVSALSVGASIVLYDGAPFAPNDDHLFAMAAAESVTAFGVSARYLAECERRGVEPRRHDLGALRSILSTGSPLLPASYDWVYRAIGGDVSLASISGGTDIVSCFVLGHPHGDVVRGEIQTRGLGMAVAVFEADGQAVVGEKGELVCTQPFPSMPIGFWNDPDGTRYHDAYFARFPNVWAHGDWVELTDRGTMIVYGRSDATLNPGGVRIGTAEIYRLVETLDEVAESVVIGQEWGSDTRVVLFVRLGAGVELTSDLEERIRATIRAGASPHHVPRKILAVEDIPRTASGKVSELAVRHVVHGRAIDNERALANPESLDGFRDRPELAD